MLGNTDSLRDTNCHICCGVNYHTVFHLRFHFQFMCPTNPGVIITSALVLTIVFIVVTIRLGQNPNFNRIKLKLHVRLLTVYIILATT